MGFGGLVILALFLFKRERREDPNFIQGPNPLAPNPAMAGAGYEQLTFYSPAGSTTFPNRMSDGDASNSAVCTMGPFQPGGYSGVPEI